MLNNINKVRKKFTLEGIQTEINKDYMIPVVLIHKGMHEYVQYTLKQANKKNEVHLLGDTAPNIEDINFYSIN